MEKIMQIEAKQEGIFVKRLNKFLGIVDIGSHEKIHIHDPGRLEKLLYEGNKVLIGKAENEKRKTKWDLVAAWYRNKWSFVNSMFHSKIAEHLIPKIFKAEKIEREKKYNESRLDFFINNEMWIEVKGCTLEENNIALFPDAPTARGRRHLAALINAMENGYKAAILFLVFVPSSCFIPNERIDKKFSHLFYEGISKGMEVYPALMEYDGKWVYYKKLLPLCKEI